MNIENLKEILNQFGWEYQLESIRHGCYQSPLFEQILNNHKDLDIYQYHDHFYKLKSKAMTLDHELIHVKYFEDVSAYIEIITNLQKDELTGLYTRKKLEKYIADLLPPSTVVLLDIDDFKQINDNYGHQVGDQVLKKLGQLIIGHIRQGDFAARYGGEEILIIFKTNQVQFVKKRIETMNHLFQDSFKEFQTTFSAGISLYDKTNSIQDCMKQADDALYYVKRHGKNNSLIYDKRLENEISK